MDKSKEFNGGGNQALESTTQHSENQRRITPLGAIDTTVRVPGSKSYTNRAILISALATGTTILENTLLSDDTQLLAQAVRDFGRTSISIEDEGTRMVVTTEQGPTTAPEQEVFMGNAGTPIRILTSYASLASGKSYITGDRRMQERPIQDLIDALQQLGVPIRISKGNGCPPVDLSGPSFKGGKASIRGSVSSQYTTSVLLSAPYAEQDVELEVTGDLTSKPYLEMTLHIMREFGVDVEREGYKRFRVRSGQRYQSRRYRIEPDASNTSYFLAAAAILGGRVRIPEISTVSAQGDAQFAYVLERLGCAVNSGEDFIEVRGGPLSGIEVDMNWMPDLVPTLAIVAAYAEGKTHITNIANLRIKECDRIAAMQSELGKMGVRTESTDDTLTVYGGVSRGAEIDTYDDHRIAMSFAVAGLRTPDVIVRDPGCVAKSFPTFWQVLDELYEG